MWNVCERRTPYFRLTSAPSFTLGILSFWILALPHLGCQLRLTRDISAPTSTSTNAESNSSTTTSSALLAITPTSKNLTVGNSFTFSASGGTPPYTYSLVSGSGSVDSSTGLYTAPGSSGSATLQVQDAVGAVASAAITFNPLLQISPSGSLQITANPNTTYPFTAAGGVPPYSFSIPSGTGSVGASSGLYTAPVHRDDTTQVQVSDSLGNSSSVSISNIPVRTNGVVNAAVTDGTSWYLGGSFTAVNPYLTSYMAVVDLSSGDLTSSPCNFQTGFNAVIYAWAISGTSVYVGGSFTTYRGAAANFLAKIDLTTCTLDTTFTQATGTSGAVSALAVSGSALYVGGSFTTYRGAAANRLAKIDLASGNLDTTFTQATGMSSSVYALAVSGSSLYVGGNFTTYRGAAANRLAKVDLTSGNLDTTFTQVTGMNTIVSALAVSGSSLYVGGSFTTYRGAAANYLAKVDLTSGNLDTTFTQATGMNGLVNALAVSGSSLYTGGFFTTYRGTAANRLAKVDLTSGNLDTTFTQVTGMSSDVIALAVSGSSLYVGGIFTTYRGTAANRLAKVDLTSGNLDTTFTQATGMNSTVYALAVSGSALYVGGNFTTYRGVAANNLAKVDLASGNLDTTFTQATGMNNGVYVLVISGSSLYVGGNFTTYRGAAANYLAKIDLASGNLNTTFTQATGMSASVSALAVSGSALYVGGSFSTYRGATANYLAKVDLTSGNLDTTFTQATGMSSSVYALAVSGSALYTGGSFTTYRGAAANYLAKIDRTTS